MNTPFARTLAIAILACCIAACTAPAPYVDAHLGHATQDMRQAQILNPQASRNMNPPLGLDGPTARATYEQYQNSYKTPEKSSNNAFVIGVGR